MDPGRVVVGWLALNDTASAATDAFRVAADVTFVAAFVGGILLAILVSVCVRVYYIVNAEEVHTYVDPGSLEKHGMHWAVSCRVLQLAFVAGVMWTMPVLVLNLMLSTIARDISMLSIVLDLFLFGGMVAFVGCWVLLCHVCLAHLMNKRLRSIRNRRGTRVPSEPVEVDESGI